MNGALLFYAGIAFVFGVIVLLDWLGERHDRQSRHNRP
jgi:hypothetical protein